MLRWEQCHSSCHDRDVTGVIWCFALRPMKRSLKAALIPVNALLACYYLVAQPLGGGKCSRCPSWQSFMPTTKIHAVVIMEITAQVRVGGAATHVNAQRTGSYLAHRENDPGE